MNEYRVVYETDMGNHFTIMESWRILAETKQEAKDRVLAVHENSKVLTVRKMPSKASQYKVNNMNMTKEEYQKAIPSCCIHKTVEAHGDNMLYCWGITSGFLQYQGESYCNSCSENINCKKSHSRPTK